jgi:hypothetical protein
MQEDVSSTFFADLCFKILLFNSFAVTLYKWFYAKWKREIKNHKV